ncbi:MAG: hydrolase [Tissierellales bacterium]|nr:hydrolase [Tissierellales bacterium]
MKNYRIDKENTIMLMIDIQERLAPAIFNSQEIIKNQKILIKGLNKLNIPIIYTEQYPKGLGKTLNELTDLLEEKVAVEKIVFSAYTDEVKEKIKVLNVKNIIITGMETHVCVYQTVRDLVEDGYNCFVIKDAVGSRTKENYENGLFMMNDLGAVISNTETILFDLIKKAGSDEFKFISNLIK